MPFATIDTEALTTVGGGAGLLAKPAASDDDKPRTWGTVAKQYAGACAAGAMQATMFNLPSSKKEGLVAAGVGCALGVGIKAVEDLTGYSG